MKDLITYILSAVVQNPDDIEVNITEDSPEQQTVTLHVPTDSMGQIIGKQGKTVNSIRQILRLWGHKNEQRINLQIEEK